MTTTLQGTFEDVAGVAVPGVRYTVSTLVPIATADGIRIKPRDLTADADGHWSINLVGGHFYTIAVDKRAGIPWGPVTVLVPDVAGPLDIKDLVPAEDPDQPTTFWGTITAAIAAATLGLTNAETPEKYGATGTGTDAALDSDALASALATGKSVVLRKNATYLLDRPLTLAGQRLNGNGATIKRAPQVSTTTTTAITSGVTTSIVVASVAGLRVGQSITVVNGSTFDTSNRVITAINTGTKTVTVSTTFGVTVTGTTTVYTAFVPITLTGDSAVENLKLDGNKANWAFNRWQNTAELVTTGDRNLIRGVYSNNAPGEGAVIFGNRNVVRDSWFTNLNGNGVHFSGAIHPVCDNVTVITPNMDTVVGHADGCIIWSNSTSDATITNCYMEGGIAGIGGIDSIDNSDVTIIGNTIRNPTTYAMDLVCPQTDPARLVITGNRIYLNANTPVTISNTNGTPTVWPNQIVFANNYLSGPAGATLLAMARLKKVTVAGNHFDLGSATTGSVLTVAVCDGVNVRNNTFTGGQYGLVASTNTRLTVGGNHFYNQNTNAINMTDASTSALIEGNVLTNDGTASATYNGMVVRDRHIVRGNYIELTGGRSGIAGQTGAVLKDNTVRHGAATYSIRVEGTGLFVKDNEVTTAVSVGGGASGTETGTIVVP